jgi:hypothetical protein
VPWILPSDVEAALGTPVPLGTPDADYLDMAVDAANAWAFRRRKAAGYVDDPDITTADVALGTVLYAVGLYRERGSVDSFDSFMELAGGYAPQGTSTQINRLLGIGKPQIDRPAVEVVP